MQLVVVGSLFWRETIWTTLGIRVIRVIRAQSGVLVVEQWYRGRFINPVELCECKVWKNATGIGRRLAAIRRLYLHQLEVVVPDRVLKVRQDIVGGKIAFYLAAILIGLSVRGLGVGAAVPNSTFIVA